MLKQYESLAQNIQICPKPRIAPMCKIRKNMLLVQYNVKTSELLAYFGSALFALILTIS